MSGLPGHIIGRETGMLRDPRDLPRPSCGVLVLDEKLRPSAFPGGPLTCVSEPIHYLDLGGIQATSLRDFGGPSHIWAGVTKLYASHCGLQRLDGIEQLQGVLWLYLDNNQLCEAELLKLKCLPPGQLKALDISGNPGCEEEVIATLEEGGLFRALEYLNGLKWKPTPVGNIPRSEDGGWDP